MLSFCPLLVYDGSTSIRVCSSYCLSTVRPTSPISQHRSVLVTHAHLVLTESELPPFSSLRSPSFPALVVAARIPPFVIGHAFRFRTSYGLTTVRSTAPSLVRVIPFSAAPRSVMRSGSERATVLRLFAQRPLHLSALFPSSPLMCTPLGRAFRFRTSYGLATVRLTSPSLCPRFPVSAAFSCAPRSVMRSGSERATVLRLFAQRPLHLSALFPSASLFCCVLRWCTPIFIRLPPLFACRFFLRLPFAAVLVSLSPSPSLSAAVPLAPASPSPASSSSAVSCVAAPLVEPLLHVAPPTAVSSRFPSSSSLRLPSSARWCVSAASRFTGWDVRFRRKPSQSLRIRLRFSPACLGAVDLGVVAGCRSVAVSSC